QLVYFAHDAAHYTGVQINGCAGIDACFGRVTFVTHDFCLPSKDAYNEAFERARRKNALFCYIVGTVKHFVKPVTADETVANSLCELNLNLNTVPEEETMTNLLNKMNIT
uniref:PFK domain-containing protein n=1 Tax=Panagrellus redivivus TaxID=6233 RepID=A0A7E4VG19_PANRE